MNPRMQIGGRRWNARSAVAATLVLASLAFIADMSRADNGRDFAGEFAIVSQDAIDSQNMLVTVRLRVQNVSGNAVSGAKVELVSDPVGLDGTAFSGPLTLADRDIAVLEGSFTVPAEQAARWVEAGRPAFRVTYTDLSGNTWQRPVEAIQMPFVPEGQP